MLIRKWLFFILIGFILFAFMACQNTSVEETTTQEEVNTTMTDEEIIDTSEQIDIEGVGVFSYDASEVLTVRQDIFKEGHFSIFAILVHLSEKGDFEMNYYFDQTMNTYVIEDINGINNCWYSAYYDGGREEYSVYRIDHYLYKEKMTIRLYEENQERIEGIHQTYKEEVNRYTKNNGKIIIPEIIIDGSHTSYIFYDVEIVAHDLRDDIYQEGVITAIDVIMTLGDMEEIDYELRWYDSIGSAEIVRSYWVHSINDDVQEGYTGFVYEAGAWDYYLFQGNHIHIPSDTRPLNSPEYVRFFWFDFFETE